MHEGYGDILSRIAEPPTWWDSNGTPRYGEFHPGRCPNIYSKLVALLRIECQACGESFNVEMHTSWFERLNHQVPRTWHYGDPPRHFCSGGGETMNCEDREVLQVWRKEFLEDWERLTEFEGLIDEKD